MEQSASRAQVRWLDHALACAAQLGQRLEWRGLPRAENAGADALAREASFALAQGAQAGLGALYLSSAPGNGKTHLARALVSEVRRGGGRRVIYESAETFTNRFMAALRGRSTEQFKRRYRRGCDLLVLEDLQFVASKKATQRPWCASRVSARKRRSA